MEHNWLYGDPSPDDEPLPPPGWYPVMHEWEAPEGFSAKASYFDGKAWLDKPDGFYLRGSVLWLNEPQPDAASAERIANEKCFDI